MKLFKYSVNELMCIGEHALQKDVFVYASTPIKEYSLSGYSEKEGCLFEVSTSNLRKFFDSDFKYLGTEVVSDDLLTEVK